MLCCLFNTFNPAQLSSDGPVLFTFARLLPSRTKNSQDNEVRSLLIGAPSQTRWPRVLPILEALLKRTCLDAIDHWFSSHYITYIFHRACVCNPTVNFPNLCIDEGRIWDCVYYSFETCFSLAAFVEIHVSYVPPKSQEDLLEKKNLGRCYLSFFEMQVTSQWYVWLPSLKATLEPHAILESSTRDQYQPCSCWLTFHKMIAPLQLATSLWYSNELEIYYSIEKHLCISTDVLEHKSFNWL